MEGQCSESWYNAMRRAKDDLSAGNCTTKRLNLPLSSVETDYNFDYDEFIAGLQSHYGQQNENCSYRANVRQHPAGRSWSTISGEPEREDPEKDQLMEEEVEDLGNYLEPVSGEQRKQQC